MGLTIHYALKTQGTEARARELVEALRQTAQDLPFQKLGQIVDLSGQDCDADRRSRNDPLRWLLIQAAGSVEYKPKGPDVRDCWMWCHVVPVRVIAFNTWPGEGCEAANFGLCQYPEVIQTRDGPLKTGLPGWCWRSFCKTQYASDPKCGGVPNFLCCHLTVIAMLDHAKRLGCLEEVSDEGDFWENRDVQELAKEVGSWNEMLAAFGGLLKDLVGEGPLGVESAIGAYPNFERLEAAGQGKLPPGLAALAKLIGQVSMLEKQPASLHLNAPC